MLFVGIDWGLSGSYYVILSSDGTNVKANEVGPDYEEIVEFADMLAQMQEEGKEIRVGIDRKRCPLVQALLAHGLTVYAINPKSANRARELFQPAGQKDDAGDARTHAEVVRSRWRQMTPLEPRDELAARLSCLLRQRHADVKMRTGLYQRLKALLADCAPGLHRLCCHLNRQWTQDLLLEFPLDQDLAEAHGNALNRFLRNHQMGEKTEQSIRQLHGNEDAVHLVHSEQMARLYQKQIRSLIKLIRTVTERIKVAEEQIAAALEEVPEAELLESLPIGGELTQATLVVLFRADPKGERGWRQYASFAGVSPITRQSGNQRDVRRRRACDQVLRHGLVHFAFGTSSKPHCWASAYYDRKRAEGHGHYSALRCLAHRWVKIIYSMWVNKTPYDENYHLQRRRERGSRAA